MGTKNTRSKEDTISVGLLPRVPPMLTYPRELLPIV